MENIVPKNKQSFKTVAFVVLGIVVSKFAGASAPSENNKLTADSILTNATIYTLDESLPWAVEIGFAGKKILCVGDAGACDDATGPETRAANLKGKFVLPGFIDSHNHISYSTGSNFLHLINVPDYDSFRQQVKQFSDDHPDLEWILGDGWNYSIFENGMPTAEDLDGITAGRPASFYSYDAHTQLLNTKAMELFSITDETKSSPLGEIQRGDNGKATGVFKAAIYISEQDQAQLDEVFPAADEEDVYQSFLGNLELASSVGITTIVEPQITPDLISRFERARKDQLLNAHIRLALFHPPGTTEDEVKQFRQIRERYKNDADIQVPAIKLYIDDVIESETAAVFEPYVGTDNIGELFFEPDEFTRIVTRLDKQGFQLFIHAIGDRGIHTALNALESAWKSNGKPALPHQIVHVELLQPTDVNRFAKYDVSASIQPRHSSPEIISQWAQSVGEYRHKNAWPLNSLKQAGARFAFASDWNVAEMDPLIGIYTAVTRQTLDGHPARGWQPQEKLDLHTSISGYTLSGAISNGIAEQRGSLSVGKFADLVVLSDNLFKISPQAIKDVQVLETYFEGKRVYLRH